MPAISQTPTRPQPQRTTNPPGPRRPGSSSCVPTASPARSCTPPTSGLKTEKRKKKDGEEWTFDPFLVSKDGKIVAFDPNDEKTPVAGDLFVDTEIKGVKAKSVLQIYREAAAARTLADWAKTAGIKESDIVELAQEFTSHGKKAVVDIHRGVSQLTSGFYNVVIYMTLNVLIGNHDWQGGLAKATTYEIMGDREGKPFKLSDTGRKAEALGHLHHPA